MITANKRSSKTKKTTRTTTKKTTKRTSTKSTVSAANRSAIRSTYTKTQILSGIAENTGLTKKDVGNVFCELEGLICQHLKKGGAGEFVVPGLMKIMTKYKAATKARKGINPFTGETTTFKAKPARNVIKVRPLKKLKDMV